MGLVVDDGSRVADCGAVQLRGKCRAGWVLSPKEERTMGA